MEETLKLKNSEKKDYHYEEAIKTLRTNLQFCSSSMKVIMFTSSLPDEGKSEITFALASSFGSIGKKVLLVDGDIRKSVLVKRYEIKGNPNGLSQYLSGQKPLEKVLYHTDRENLDMILAGPYSPDPAELLEDTLFRDMLEKARENYDYIIIDTPPMGSVIDGAIIAGHCDGAVIVLDQTVADGTAFHNNDSPDVYKRQPQDLPQLLSMPYALPLSQLTMQRRP